MDLSNEPDDRLLARMGRKCDTDGSRAAWEAFYRRHREFLYRVCLKACCERDPHEGAKDLVVETFKRVYKSAATFVPPEADSAEEMQLLVRAWLSRIAKRIAIDQHRRLESSRPILLGPEEWREVRERPGETASEHTEEVCRMMNEVLDERERDVIRTTFLSYDPEKEHQKLSPEDVQALAKRWNTSPDNIRQIRKRGLAKLEKGLLASRAGTSSERAGP